MAQDFYKVLGISRRASTAEIKSAYRKLAKKFHPDVNKGNKSAEDRFKQISEAYETLGDAKKKAQYDQFGDLGGRGGFNPRGQTSWSYTTKGSPSGINLEDLMGGGGGDLGQMFEGIFGMERTRQGSTRVRYGGSRPQAKVKRHLRSTFNISKEELEEGTKARVLLFVEGQGQQLELKIPKGIKDGAMLRLRGKGENGGDLILTIRVKGE